LRSTRAPAYRQRRMLIITFWEHTKNERNIFILCGQIYTANTIEDLSDVWPRLSFDEKKLFEVIARAYHEARIAECLVMPIR
jgi:hypothetical protein